MKGDERQSAVRLAGVLGQFRTQLPRRRQGLLPLRHRLVGLHGPVVARLPVDLAVESALKKRKHKPMFMLDIAVPRDIEEQVGELDDVYLYTVDDLHAVIDENKKSRVAAADQAEEIISEGVEQFLRHQRALNAVETVKAYRQKAEQLRDLELQKALRSLQGGANAEQVLQQFARNLTNKLIHSPTTVLKEASASSRHHVIQVAHELFELSFTSDGSVNPAADPGSDASEQ